MFIGVVNEPIQPQKVFKQIEQGQVFQSYNPEDFLKLFCVATHQEYFDYSGPKEGTIIGNVKMPIHFYGWLVEMSITHERDKKILNILNKADEVTYVWKNDTVQFVLHLKNKHVTAYMINNFKN